MLPLEESLYTIENRDVVNGFSLKSRVPGRDRWVVSAIVGDRNRALALEHLVGSETGIRRVVANELTGRILVEYIPGQLKQPVEALIWRALAFGPMLKSELGAVEERPRCGYSPLGLLVSAELGCVLFKALFAGLLCPCVGTTAGLAFTIASLSRSQWTPRREPPVTGSAVRLKTNQAR
jgi:hypothetical protein